MQFRRTVLRPATWGAALLITALATGCSDGTSPAAAPSSSSAAPSSAPPAASSSTPSTPSNPSTPATTEASPEPSPVISHQGKTKIITLGDVEVRVTRGAIGFNVACNATNTYDRTLNIRVTVSVGIGEDWVRATEFDFPNVAAGQTGRETTLVGDSYEGELPDEPKVYIDSVINY
ncbi:hypothetical protein [Streptomyces sp. BE230]|uniref:hypothetical protein n=1 Tax=Streptomyces sp. BE230 TaxID=3002526 RepID=UPI002ED5E412|nr:hypothetical protein [Streptomyces sp. BE230]